MPEALFLALPIVGGYLAVTTMNVSRYRAARDTGHHQYFRIIQYGIVLSGIALVLVQLVWAISASLGVISVALVTDYPMPDEIVTGLLAGIAGTAIDHRWHVAALAFGFGYLASYVCNTDASRQMAIEDAIQDQDLEQIIAKSQQGSMPILCTLKSGKVYLGWPVKGPSPDVSRRWLTLLPLASGYRDSTQTVRFVVNYAPILERVIEPDDDLPENVSLEQFEIALASENIVGVHLFDIRVYRLFDPDGAELFDPPDSPASPPAPAAEDEEEEAQPA